ncbi:hypothetical protein L9F63_006542, partial [Diploptera punctata]
RLSRGFGNYETPFSIPSFSRSEITFQSYYTHFRLQKNISHKITTQSKFRLKE